MMLFLAQRSLRQIKEWQNIRKSDGNNWQPRWLPDCLVPPPQVMKRIQVIRCLTLNTGGDAGEKKT
jgi:hypothetical protein